MKRYNSAFAVPSGFAVASSVRPVNAARRESVQRGSEMHAIVPAPAKPRSALDLRDRAA